MNSTREVKGSTSTPEAMSLNGTPEVMGFV